MEKTFHVETEGTEGIDFDTKDYSSIQNIVTDIRGYGLLRKEQIKYIYMSEMRICITMSDGLELNIPVIGGGLDE